METQDGPPTTAELWALLQEQAAEMKQLKRKAAEVDELKAEVERQRLEKVSLVSRLAEVEESADGREKTISRRGLLKAAAAGAAGLAGAGLLTRAQDAAAAPAPGVMYYAGYNSANYLTGLVAVNDASSGTYPSPVVFSAYPDNVNPISGTFDGIWATGHGSGSGLAGYAGGATGSLNAAANAGVAGFSSSASNAAVYGENNNNGIGVNGFSSNGVGGEFHGGVVPLQLDRAVGTFPPSLLNGRAYSPGMVWIGGANITDPGTTVWFCTAPGNPGSWVPLMHGNSNDAAYNTLFTKVSTQQYTLKDSDGVTWVDMDGTNLSLSITPKQNSLAIISGNSDLWTSQAGYNQDIGITISGGAYPTHAGQPEAWKESGGFAGTFSPNAAFVQAVKPLTAGIAYTIKLQWKANKSATGATIWAGAGPIGGQFSPTSLTVLLIPTP